MNRKNRIISRRDFLGRLGGLAVLAGGQKVKQFAVWAAGQVHYPDG